jgi:hypothetical protein
MLAAMRPPLARRSAVRLLAAAGALLLAAAPRAGVGQATPLDLDGPWLVSLARAGPAGARAAGAGALAIGEPDAGDLPVAGGGMSLDLGTFFVVAADQSLHRDSAGRIAGSLALEDGAGGSLGTLVVEEGRANAASTSFTWPARLEAPGAEPVALRLKGTRPPAALPVLTGRSTKARVAGGGTRSRFYELAVSEDALGFPVFGFAGSGPVSVDGQEHADVATAGRFLVDAKGHLFGTFASALLGDGTATGRLRLAKATALPRVVLKVRTATRRLQVAATLDKAVSPILSVRPAGDAVFGPVDLLSSAQRVFTVSNAGVGLLEGSASIESGDADFALVDGVGAVVDRIDYALAEGEEAEVRVRFQPLEGGERSAVLAFTGGGGATRGLTGVGQDLAVTPAAGLDFGSVAVGESEDLQLTVTNVGPVRLQGQATLGAGAPDFALVEGGSEVTAVAYDLAPGGSRKVTVRFAPETAGAKSGEVAFVGGSGATRPLLGTATAAP